MLKNKIIGTLLYGLILSNIAVVNANAVSEIDPLETKWQSSINSNGNDTFRDTALINDGGFISVGRIQSTNISGITNKGFSDAIIAKHNKDGVQEWVKSFGGNKDDNFNNIVKLKDNNFIAIGVTNSTDISGITNKGLEDILIVKYDVNGNVLWSKTWGGNQKEDLYNATSTNDGGFVVVGGTKSTNISNINSKGISDAFIVKFNNNGEEEWVKSFGGNNDDYFKDVINTSDNGYIVVGEIMSTDLTDITNNGVLNGVIAKYDSNGNREWIKSFGGSNIDFLNNVIEIENGIYTVGGVMLSSDVENIPVSEDELYGVILQYNNNGELTYTKTIENEFFIEFVKTQSNNIIILTENIVDSSIGLLKYNKDFNESYRQAINNIMSFSEMSNINIATINDDSLIISGANENMNCSLAKYVYPVKTLNTTDTLNLQVVADNSLEMSLSTNQISFKGYNGVSDLTNNDLNITVTSGLYYDLFATLNDELRGSNDTQATINKINLGIKTLDDVDYKNFINIGEPLKLVENHVNGRNMNHNINLKLKGDSSVKADTYSTTITFETIQK